MRTALMLAVLALVAAPVGAQDRLADQLRKGIAEEETTQNIEKAIQSYQAIVTRYDEDRKVAGSAMFRLAECYRKAGKREQAISAYQRLIREFPDQQAMLATSQQQLKALGVHDLADVVPPRAPRERPREVVPERGERVPKRSLADAAGPGLEATKLQIEAARVELARAEQMAARGLVAPADVVELQAHIKELEQRLRQQIDEIALNQQMIESVQKEIVLVQDQIAAMEKRIKVGTFPADAPELLQLRRDLLNLQRRLYELQAFARR